MPEKEQQDKTLSEIVVKEAVGKGLDSPMRDSILEAVEEADSSRSRGRRLPLVGAAFGLGAALGFLAGQQSTDLEETPLEDLEEPEIIEDVTERVESETGAELTEEAEAEPAAESEETSGSRLPKLLLALGVIAGAVFLRQRLGGESEEEWEPIEEFEPATSEEEEEEAEDEAEEEEAEEAEGEGEETEEEEE